MSETSIFLHFSNILNVSYLNTYTDILHILSGFKRIQREPEPCMLVTRNIATSTGTCTSSRQQSLHTDMSASTNYWSCYVLDCEKLDNISTSSTVRTVCYTNGLQRTRYYSYKQNCTNWYLQVNMYYHLFYGYMYRNRSNGGVEEKVSRD